MVSPFYQDERLINLPILNDFWLLGDLFLDWLANHGMVKLIMGWISELPRYTCLGFVPYSRKKKNHSLDI